MNKKNLILTSTVNMNREQWLAFRQPMNHVSAKYLAWIKENKYTGEDHYNYLKKFFASDEWKEYIFPCVGGSEIAAILGLSPWKASIELFYEKVGVKKTYDEDNAAMFWGRELEEDIAEKWQYWDGSPEGMISNFTADNIIRKCRRLRAYVQNKRFPWIFVSLDRLINKQNTGMEVTNEGVLECKTISGWAANMWEGGIPPSHVAQLQTQLAVVEMDFGEIAILKDGRIFEVLPFDMATGIVDRLVNESERFFQNVKKGIAHYLLSRKAPNDTLREKHYSDMEQLAPEPDGSEAYKNYLSETYQEGIREGILGGIVQDVQAKNYVYYRDLIKKYETYQLECANHLKAFMKDARKMEVESGRIHWKNNVKGSRTFNVTVKVPEGYLPEDFREVLEPYTPKKRKAKEGAKKAPDNVVKKALKKKPKAGGVEKSVKKKRK